MFHQPVKTTFQNGTRIAGAPLRDAMVLGAMFAAACQGAVPLGRALATLRQDTDADMLTLVRIDRKDGAQLVATTAAQHTIIDADAAAFAVTLGKLADELVAGHVLPDLANTRQSAIVLQTAQGFTDVLIAQDGDAQMFANFAAMAVPFWAARRDGIAIAAISAISDLKRESARINADSNVVQGCILSAMNPAKLTPTEFRVALALRSGLSPAAIAERMAIAMPTVRTHLRNLYSKTGLRGMHELTHRLHADAAL